MPILTWYGLLLKDGRLVMGNESREDTRRSAPHLDAAMLVKVVFKSAEHMRAFFTGKGARALSDQ